VSAQFGNGNGNGGGDDNDDDDRFYAFDSFNMAGRYYYIPTNPTFSV